MREKTSIFLKGMLMGICDLIPGISGGTIAFITGIYERLIYSVRNISFVFILDVLRYPFTRKLDKSKVDLPFLVTLGLGIATSILIGSRLIGYLMDAYFVYTISFFIGLILASSRSIFNSITDHSAANISFSILGLAIGISLAFLIPVYLLPSYTFVFIGGLASVSAMFLPGISGAFILLILGLYEFMIGLIRTMQGIDYILVFLAGAFLGMMVISRLITMMFTWSKPKTLYLLLGLVIGALGIPISKLIPLLGSANTVLASVCLLLGAGIIVAVQRGFGA